jgi:hypothetical protein
MCRIVLPHYPATDFKNAALNQRKGFFREKFHWGHAPYILGSKFNRAPHTETLGTPAEGWFPSSNKTIGYDNQNVKSINSVDAPNASDR